MEVAVGRSGGDPVTGEPGEERSEAANGTLNVVLLTTTVVCLIAVLGIGWLIGNTYEHDEDRVAAGGFWDRTWAVVADKQTSGTETRAGEDVGGATAQALPLASVEERERRAAVIDSATKMANAFLNLRHDDPQASIEAVKSLATGTFGDQYDKAASELVKVVRRAQTVQTGEVLWAGLVAGDEDSATVIVASTGTVSNKVTDFKPQARNYRLRLDLQLVDGRWLTRDLQFVA